MRNVEINANFHLIKMYIKLKDHFDLVQLLFVGLSFICIGDDNTVLIKVIAGIWEHGDIAKKSLTETRHELSDDQRGCKLANSLDFGGKTESGRAHEMSVIIFHYTCKLCVHTRVSNNFTLPFLLNFANLSEPGIWIF